MGLTGWHSRGAAGMLLVSLAVSACGSSHGSAASAYAKQPVGKIIAATASALDAATSFQGTGSIKIGQSYAGVSFSIVLPTNIELTLRKGSSLIQLISLPGASYINANTVFWQMQRSGLTAAQASEFSNRWYRAPAATGSSLTKSLKGFSPKRLATCLAQDNGDLRVIGTATIAGQATVVLHQSGQQPGTYPADLYVSSSAPHYLVRLRGMGRTAPGGTGPCADTNTSEGAEHNVLSFSHWNAVHITAPPNAKPLP
jgi:hypothetical protein